jgi:hypothetical protein
LIIVLEANGELGNQKEEEEEGKKKRKEKKALAYKEIVPLASQWIMSLSTERIMGFVRSTHLNHK